MAERSSPFSMNVTDLLVIGEFGGLLGSVDIVDRRLNCASLEDLSRWVEPVSMVLIDKSEVLMLCAVLG